MLAPPELDNDLSQEGYSECDDYHVVFSLCDEDYLESTCRVIVSGERFLTRNEYIYTFKSHGRAKFDLKTRFIYLQENPMEACQYL